MEIKVGDRVKIVQDLYQGDDSLAAYGLRVGDTGTVSEILNHVGMCPVRVKFDAIHRDCDVEFEEIILLEDK